MGRRPGAGLHRAGPGPPDVPDRRDITVAYPELARLGAATRASSSCCWTARSSCSATAAGRSSRRCSRGCTSPRPRRRAAGPADAGHVPGLRRAPAGRRPLLDLPYAERRALLDELGLAGPSWQTPPWFPGRTRTPCGRVRRAPDWKAWWPSGSTRRYAPGAPDRQLAEDQEHAHARRRSWPAGQAGRGQPDRAGRLAAHRRARRLRPDLRRPRRHRVHRRDAAHARHAAAAAAPRTPRSTARSRPSTPARRLGRARARGRGRLRPVDQGGPHAAPRVYKGLRDDMDPTDVVREP